MSSGHITIENEVPFGQTVYGWLYLKDLQLDDVVQHDRVERNYLAWETVRKQTNPFLETGTGFEGYLIGRCTTPEAALDVILATCQHILDAIRRMYRFEYGFRSLLMQTLLRENSHSALIHIWAEYLGAELGRMRAQILNNEEAQRFQSSTYRIVETLPPIVYRQVDDQVTQTYAVGSNGHQRSDRLSITLPMLKPSQQDAWLVAENIGQFGHPLLRSLLERYSSPVL